ncbi:MAG: transcription termination factor NusA [Patescibacteria group bacterium]|nr:transcription termination factor NusA [Patescibacteria group bacterium]MDD5164545.1 transcription termination factor NusA [Patescibacteria group bacterium]MDD5534713.1 transcription termination factor NusA [Patescibacteria group bacterium]
MASPILAAIDQICQEKKLSKEQVVGAIEQALSAAYRRDFGQKNQDVKVEFDPETGKMRVFDIKTVVEDLPEIEDESATEEVAVKEKKTKKKSKKSEEEVLPVEPQEEKEEKHFNPRTELQLSDAKKISKKYKIGDIIKTELEIHSDFGRIAAQTAKQVIVQRLKEIERSAVFQNYKSQEKQVVDAVVQRLERNVILIDLQDATAVLPYTEQVQEERYWPGQKIKVYILMVSETNKGPEIIVSRRHPDILKELFRSEIPEIASGTVEIKVIAREAGSRSKIAVFTSEKNLDPIGSCIGQKGARIQTIISEIGGEKIDIIEYSEDPKKFIANALAPAKTVSLKIDEKNKEVSVKVRKNQLSLAIGRAGQNVRLASRLTGYKIEVQLSEEEEVEATTEEVKKEKSESSEKESE